MKCETSNIEIETIYHRIQNGDINLQPDFQRGEIWPMLKKRKLIDSILRGWKIPPIHVVHGSFAIDEVLDGQQRLAAIRDFLEDGFTINGNLEPIDMKMKELHGFFFSQLSKEIQRSFRQYSIIMIRLTEFKPAEPAELFYRLNQPAALTSAEQRNAFIGVTRDQVKHLVSDFENYGASKDLLGFSNSRLAYDEVISKLCFTIELGTLKKKISSAEISSKYRNELPFSSETIEKTGMVLNKFIECAKYVTRNSNVKIIFNKATLFSWLVFIKSNYSISQKELIEGIMTFELTRLYIKGHYKDNIFKDFQVKITDIQKKYPFFEGIINVYNQKASVGSTDAIAIIYRDIITNLAFVIFGIGSSVLNDNLVNDTILIFNAKQNISLVLEEISAK